MPILDTSTSSMRLDSREAQIIRQASLIVIDEVPMLNNEALRCIDQLLCEIMQVDKSFGGKTMVIGGDFRQTLPIVRKGTRAQIVNACIKSCSLWRCFKQLKLTTNMRAQADSEFAAWIIQVGDGTAPTLPNGQIEIPQDMIVEDVVEAIYGTDINSLTTEQLAERVVLATTNKEVLKINNTITNQLLGEIRTYTSADSIERDENIDPDLYTEEFLHAQTPSGMPPHELKLKVGAIVLLLRNMLPKKGLCNGTRLKVLSMHDNFIRAQIISGYNRGGVVFVPRIDLTPSDTNLPFTLKRRQFPIIPAFAMTINKSQGQTFEQVGIYLEEPVFGHGQLYTALSRSKRKNNVKICIKDTKQQGCLLDDQRRFTPNIVFHEVLN